MNTVTILIKDVDNTVEVEGQIDKEALDKPPTPALVIGTYISTNIGDIASDAMKWFKRQVEEDTDEPKLFAPREKGDA